MPLRAFIDSEGSQAQDHVGGSSVLMPLRAFIDSEENHKAFIEYLRKS